MSNEKERMKPAHSSTTNYPFLAKLVGFGAIASPVIAILLVALGVLRPGAVAMAGPQLLVIRIAAVAFTVFSILRVYRSEEKMLKSVTEKRQRPEQVYMFGTQSGVNAIGGAVLILLAGGSLAEFYGFAAISIAAWIVWQLVWRDKKEMYERAYSQAGGSVSRAS
jgi:hypothetical protein